ncbi:MAG: hypothetical protein JXA60_09070 [Candidatus Coatesbacteria bacterium]|nr:hypothetical protein [Candidatus Coatesbacteria bacterium]
MLKRYTKPVIRSEKAFEKTALTCADYSYYAKAEEDCYDEYLGQGKLVWACVKTLS